MQIVILTVRVQKRGNIKGASCDVLQQIAIAIELISSIIVQYVSCWISKPQTSIDRHERTKVLLSNTSTNLITFVKVY